MGISGIGIWQLVIILVIVIMLFGTKRLRNIGTDLGSAIKGFKKSVSDDEASKSEEAEAKSDADSARNVEDKTDSDSSTKSKADQTDKEKKAQH